MGQAGDAAKGAASGAASGALIGSMVPGIGTGIGAAAGGIVGGIGGWFGGGSSKPKVDVEYKGYDQATQQIAAAAQAAQARRAAQLQGQYRLDPGQMSETRAGALGVANRLGAIASGQQAGAGELAVNRQLSAAQAAQVAQARMARGGNAALAARTAARNQADIGLAGASQAAQAQMEDQQAANAQLGSLYSSLYGQDANVAAQNAQLGQQAAIENLRAEMAQRGMNDAQQMNAIQQRLAWEQSQVNARLAKEGLPPQQSFAGNLLQGAGGLALAYAGQQKAG